MDKNAEIRILIADDHPIFRSGLRAVIEKERRFSVVAEAENGASAVELIERYAPDIAVLDLDMPETDGFAAALELQKTGARVKIVFLTMHKDEMHFNRAVDLGVSGYVVKDDAAAEIVDCLKTVAAGREYFSPAVSAHFLKRVRRPTDFSAAPGIGDLTPTERRVLYLLSELKTSREIAAELGISPRTVENHRAHICSKLGLQGSHALTKFAVRHKHELA